MLCWPPGLDARVQRWSWYPKRIGRVGNDHEALRGIDPDVASRVSRLLFLRRPLHIPGEVPALIVDSFDGVAPRRPLSHMCSKRQQIRFPRLIHRDPAPAVIVKVPLFGVGASIDHFAPSAVQRVLTKTVSCPDIPQQTAAGFCVPDTKRSAKSDLHGAAVASHFRDRDLLLPFRRSVRWFDNGPSTEARPHLDKKRFTATIQYNRHAISPKDRCGGQRPRRVPSTSRPRHFSVAVAAWGRYG